MSNISVIESHFLFLMTHQDKLQIILIENGYEIHYTLDIIFYSE